jgi:hypothetical protein
MEQKNKTKSSNFLYTLLCAVIGKSPLRSKTRTENIFFFIKNKEKIIKHNDKIFKITVSEGGRKAYVFEIKNNTEFYILKYDSVVPNCTLNLVIKTIIGSNQNLKQAFQNHLIDN